MIIEKSREHYGAYAENGDGIFPHTGLHRSLRGDAQPCESGVRLSVMFSD